MALSHNDIIGMLRQHIKESLPFRGGNLNNADLQGIQLDEIDMYKTKLRNADLRGASLKHAFLVDIDFTGANLQNADLSGAYLRYANLTQVDLSEANLSGADLYGANFDNTNLTGTDLSRADIRDACLRGVELGKSKNPPVIIEGLYLPVYASGFGMLSIGTHYLPVKEWKHLDHEDLTVLLADEFDSVEDFEKFYDQYWHFILTVADTYQHQAK
jgi:hypothetical protein